MPLPITRRWTQKPPFGTPINWGYPLTQNLWACWLFNENGGSTVYDIGPSRSNGTINGTTCIWGTQQQGVDLSKSATDTTGNISTNAVQFNWERTQPFTLEALVFIPSTLTTTMGLFGNSGSSKTFYCEIPTSAAVVFGVVNTPSTNALVVGTPSSALTKGAWNHIAITYDGSSTPAGCAIYVNGVNQSLTTVFNNLTASIVNNDTYKILTSGTFPSSISGTRLAYHRIWKRPLKASEVQDLYLKPYAMFQGVSIPLWNPPTSSNNVVVSATCNVSTTVSAGDIPAWVDNGTSGSSTSITAIDIPAWDEDNTSGSSFATVSALDIPAWVQSVIDSSSSSIAANGLPAWVESESVSSSITISTSDILAEVFSVSVSSNGNINALEVQAWSLTDSSSVSVTISADGTENISISAGVSVATTINALFGEYIVTNSNINSLSSTSGSLVIISPFLASPLNSFTYLVHCLSIINRETQSPYPIKTLTVEMTETSDSDTEQVLLIRDL